MASLFDADVEAAAAPDTLALFGESVVIFDADETARTVTAVVDYLPDRTELRSNHRVRVESVEILAADSEAAIGDVAIDWGLDVDGDPTRSAYDFAAVQDRSGGMITALFERLTILDTGTPQPAEI